MLVIIYYEEIYFQIPAFFRKSRFNTTAKTTPTTSELKDIFLAIS